MSVRVQKKIMKMKQKSIIFLIAPSLLNTAFTARGSKIMLSRFRVTLIVVVSHKENIKKRWRKLYDSRHWVIILSSQCLERHTQLYALNCEKTTTRRSAMLLWYKAKQTQIIIFSSHFYRFGDLLVPRSFVEERWEKTSLKPHYWQFLYSKKFSFCFLEKIFWSLFFTFHSPTT